MTIAPPLLYNDINFLFLFSDRIVTILKKQFFVIGCLLLLHPSPAFTAQESVLSSVLTPFLLLLFLLLTAAVGVGWLWSQLQRLKREKNKVEVHLQLAQQALDQAPLAILWIDAALNIVQANQAALRLGAAQNLIGSNLLAFKPELGSHPVLAALQSGTEGAVAADEGCPENTSLALVASGGKQFAIWYERPMADDLQRSEGEKQHKATTGEISRAVESASRMKSEFIANINHEIRTPMNAIIGYAEMLAGTDLGPKEKRFVGIIHKSSMTLVSIFNDIMELSKIDSGRMQIMVSSVRLQSIINEVEGQFKELALEKDLRFRCRIAPHLPTVFILDGLRLKQILQNFVSNALKFTASGYVDLTVDGEPTSENAGCFNLRFSVQDSGIGIPIADQEKIFELFQQREESISKQYGGVGLGLTLCSRLVAMMGGEIELFSQEGDGARFTISLKGVKVAAQTPSQRTPEATSVLRDRNIKLLVVDDIDLIKDVFIDFFQDSPIQVLTANTGEEALLIAAQERPGIIFMDLNLVGMDGRTVTEQLRKQAETATIPVVVMTGEILEEADYKPLFDDFLQKPFRLDALKEIITRYVQSRPDTLQTTAGDIAQEEDQAFFISMETVWTEELEGLRQQATRSGSLSDAASLSLAMQQIGKTVHQSLLVELGGELMQYTAEPNILGVDRLLAKLSRFANRKQP